MKFLVSFFSLGGFLSILYGVIGGISGIFNYRLTIKGSTLPLITIPGMIAMIVIGAGCILLSRMLSKRMQKKEQNQNNTNS